MNTPSDPNGEAKKGRFGAILPFATFIILGALFFIALKAGDPSRLPSALIGKPAPKFDLPALQTADGAAIKSQSVTSAGLGEGKPAIVHFFASWCGPCKAEHPVVMALAEQLRREDLPVSLYGINYKDSESAAQRFLGRYGDPYTKIGVDGTGRTAIDFGVYGVPETFVISADGKIAFRQAGPLTEDVVAGKILPLLRTKPSPSASTAKTPKDISIEPAG